MVATAKTRANRTRKRNSRTRGQKTRSVKRRSPREHIGSESTLSKIQQSPVQGPNTQAKKGKSEYTERPLDKAEYVVKFYDDCLFKGKPDFSNEEVGMCAEKKSISNEAAEKELKKAVKRTATQKIVAFLDEFGQSQKTAALRYRNFKRYLGEISTWYPGRAMECASLGKCLKEYEDGSLRSSEFVDRLKSHAALVDKIRGVCRVKRWVQTEEDELKGAKNPGEPPIKIGTTELISARFFPRVLRERPGLMDALPEPTIDEPYRLLGDVENGVMVHDIVVTYGPPDEIARISDKLKARKNPDEGYTLAGQSTLYRCVIGSPDMMYCWMKEKNKDTFSMDIFQNKTVAIFRDLELIMPGEEFWKQLEQKKKRILRYKSSLEVHAYARWGGDCLGLSHVQLLNELGQEELGWLCDERNPTKAEHGKTQTDGELAIGKSTLALFVRTHEDEKKNELVNKLKESILEEFHDMRERDEWAVGLQNRLKHMSNFYQVGLIAQQGDIKRRMRRHRNGTLALRISPYLIAQGRLTLKPWQQGKTDEIFHVSGRIQPEGPQSDPGKWQKPTLGQMCFRVFESSLRIRSSAFCMFESKQEGHLRTHGMQENSLIGHWHGIDNDKHSPSEIGGYWLLCPEAELPDEKVDELIKLYCSENGLPIF